MAQQNINYDPANSGLGDTLRQAFIKVQANFTELYNNKVDKLAGWGLSQVNFSPTDKAKLDDLDPDAGTQSDWDEGDIDSPAYILNKPENLSDFTNDIGLIEDVEDIGLFFRSNGEWKNGETKIFDGIAGVTSGFTIGQTVYTLPIGSVILDVYLSHTKQYKTTANNSSLGNRWSAVDNVLTLTKASALNNYIYIEYLQG